MTTNPQSGDGYKCICGYITDDRMNFVLHINHEGRREGKDAHKSAGRVNMSTGEITMPPYLQRTQEQINESNLGKRVEKMSKDGKIVKTREAPATRTTDILASASEIRFVPRIFTTTYTPIMNQAQDAAIKIWGWRDNMPFENFLDTVIYLYFKEHGITLGQYIVADTVVRAENSGDGHEQPENNDDQREKEMVCSTK